MFQIHFISALSIGCVLSLSVSSATMAARPCPPDTNCSGAVDIDDLVTVITSWGMFSGPADVNQSGSVDIDDLVQVITRWGPCVFDFGPQYPNAEAHQIGLEMLGSTGSLTLSQPMYDRIDRDLGLIRSAYPGLAGQTHSMAWAPNQLIVGVPMDPPYTEFQCLNTFYRATDVSILFTFPPVRYYLVTFAGKLNVVRLADLYAMTPGIVSAETNGLFGGENFWSPSLLINTNWRWNIDDGFWDCFDGCDCHRAYVIDTTTAGSVNLVSYSEYGQSWCDFGSQ